MDKEKMEEIRDGLLEVSSILHVLQIALANIDQPNSDTCPYACLTGKIENRLNNILEEFN